MLSVLNGLLTDADDKQVSLTALLDLSAAFDTLDHSVLLKRLEITFGVRGTVLHWFSSYVSERVQSVIVDGSVSDHCPLLYGVPQGSVLGPVLFTLYSQPLSDVISQHNCSFHKYADDTELSKSCLVEDLECAKLSIQECISAISCWMDSNKLMLNADKTEVLIVGTASRVEQLDCDAIKILDTAQRAQSWGSTLNQRWFNVEPQPSSTLKNGLICKLTSTLIQRWINVDSTLKINFISTFYQPDLNLFPTIFNLLGWNVVENSTLFKPYINHFCFISTYYQTFISRNN